MSPSQIRVSPWVVLSPLETKHINQYATMREFQGTIHWSPIKHPDYLHSQLEKDRLSKRNSGTNHQYVIITHGCEELSKDLKPISSLMMDKSHGIIGYVKIKVLPQNSCELTSWLYKGLYKRELHQSVMRAAIQHFFKGLKMQQVAIQFPKTDGELRLAIKELGYYPLEKEIPEIPRYEFNADMVEGVKYDISKAYWEK